MKLPIMRAKHCMPVLGFESSAIAFATAVCSRERVESICHAISLFKQCLRFDC